MLTETEKRARKKTLIVDVVKRMLDGILAKVNSGQSDIKPDYLTPAGWFVFKAIFINSASMRVSSCFSATDGDYLSEALDMLVDRGGRITFSDVLDFCFLGPSYGEIPEIVQIALTEIGQDNWSKLKQGDQVVDAYVRIRADEIADYFRFVLEFDVVKNCFDQARLFDQQMAEGALK